MMIFGVCAGPSEKYASIAGPSIDRLGAGSEVIVLHDQGAIADAYNTILDRAAGRPGLEGVVLIHDDVELLDELWREKFLQAFESGFDVVGVIGGWGAGGMAWFTREHKVGRVVVPSGIEDHGRRSGEVDVLDGILLALSPWSVKHLRFESGTYPGFHGYDAEICAQARAQGRRVGVAPVDIFHHTAGVFGTKKSYEDWIRALIAWDLKWGGLSRSKRVLAVTRRALLPLEVRVRPSLIRRRRGLRP